MVNRCFRLSAGDGEQFFVVQLDVFLSCPFQPSDSCIGFGRQKIQWKLQTFSLRRCTFVYNCVCCFRSYWNPPKTVPRAWVPNLYCGLNRGKKESGQSLANKTELWDLISDCKFWNLTGFLVLSESQVDREVSQAPWSADLAAQSRMRRLCMVWLVREFLLKCELAICLLKIRRFRYPKHTWCW